VGNRGWQLLADMAGTSLLQAHELGNAGFATTESQSPHDTVRETLLVAVTKSSTSLKHAPEEMKDDREVTLIAVANNGYALQYASEGMKNNLEVVMTACANNGYALQWASEDMKNNLEVVMTAIAKYSGSLQYASAEMRGNHQVVLKAVAKHGRALQYALEELRSNCEIVWTAVGEDGHALQYASEEVQNNPEIVLKAVAQDAFALQYASYSLLEDESFAVEARMRHYFFKITALSGQSCIAAVEFLYGPGILRQCCSKLLGWESTGSEVFVHDSEMVTPSSLSADSPGGPARGKLVEYQLIRLSPPEGSASTSRSVQNPKGRLELMARAAH